MTGGLHVGPEYSGSQFAEETRHAVYGFAHKHHVGFAFVHPKPGDQGPLTERLRRVAEEAVVTAQVRTGVGVSQVQVHELLVATGAHHNGTAFDYNVANFDFYGFAPCSV